MKAFLFELCNDHKVNLYLDIDKEVNPDVYELFTKGMERIMNNEPMNYVLGYSYFYGYRFVVNDGVLIPRPETEELVGLILGKYDEYFNGKSIDLCDVGTGSGAIAIALKKEEDRLNAQNNDAKVEFFQGSMLEPFIERDIKVDILVSNPPYIKTVETIEASVYDYEPHVALFGGEDGLKFYREILQNAHKVLKPKGFIFFEMGYDLKDSLSALVKEYYPESRIEVYKDINGKDRMMMIAV